MNKIITAFFTEKKEAWLKKNLKASMTNNEVAVLKSECEHTFSLNVWLPSAAKRAGQISIATHPCTFSHPSARKNKNGYVTSIIANIEQANDGFLKTGNVSVMSDALGNAAALDVYKFLSLVMEDGRSLLSHIQQDSKLAKELLNLDAANYEELKSGFLTMIASSTENITSSKIKQVYFPVGDDYHQLSLLTNSGIVYELRNRLDSLRFSDSVKELRAKKYNNEYSEQGYSEIYNLTTIGYGGTKPQNISVLNNQHGGKAHLLLSVPPSIEKRNTYFPKRDFFIESMQKAHYIGTFKALHKIFQLDYNNIKIRNARDYHLQELMNMIVENMWAVRLVSVAQYHEETSTLEKWQLIWLHENFEKEREDSEQWLEQLVKNISHWISQTYEKIMEKQAIKLGKAEYKHISNIVEQNKEALR